MLQFPPQVVIYDYFERKGRKYSCVVIAPKGKKAATNRYHVIINLPEEDNYISFTITPSDNGHWMPDNTSIVDPWMADKIGSIILDNF